MFVTRTLLLAGNRKHIKIERLGKKAELRSLSAILRNYFHRILLIAFVQCPLYTFIIFFLFLLYFGPVLIFTVYIFPFKRPRSCIDTI